MQIEQQVIKDTNRTALKIRKRPGVVRGSFEDRFRVVRGRSGVVRGSFRGCSAVVQDSFETFSKVFSKIFGKFFEKFLNLLFSKSLGRFH